MALFQSHRERFLGGATALAVLFGGGYLFVFKPAMAAYGELVAGIALSLKTFPEADSEKAREVRIFLDWPARLKVDNATIAEKGAIESWVRTQPFAPRPS